MLTANVVPSAPRGPRISGRAAPGVLHSLFMLTLTATCLLPAGCTRRYYRRDADRQVEDILTEKNRYEPWRIENWHVYPDPQARFADPANPDRPPMPFDDPAARCLSPNPQTPGKAGQGNFEGTGYLELMQLWDAANRQDPEA